MKFKVKESSLRELKAILSIGLAIVLYLCLTGEAGPVGNMLAYNMQLLFGRGVMLFPVVLLISGGVLIFGKTARFHMSRVFGIFVAFSAFLGMLHLQSSQTEQLEQVAAFGGYVGFITSFLLRHFFEVQAAAVILGFVMVASVVVAFDITLTKILRVLHPKKLALPKIQIDVVSDKKKKRGKQAKLPLEDEEMEIMKVVKPQIEEAIEEEMEQLEELQTINPPQLETNFFEAPAKEKEVVEKDPHRYDDWKLPSLDLLEDARSEIDIDENILREKAAVIKEKLQQFGIEVVMRDINVGPTVTQYTLQPKEGIKLNKITTLKKDLALALAAKSLRIEAPIPGKSLVGIEMPNSDRMIVHIRELLESSEYGSIKSQLRLVIGRDVSGKPLIADLASMPHLLIAGRTGSGKSVCMNAFLLSLLYQNSPRDLRMILIDPKMVELGMYDGIAHLLTPVITETDKALAALRWAVAEMTRRYKELNEKKYRNIYEYNDNEEEKMCKIVIVVDELADLMMRGAKKETEGLVCRLAQMARAVGIHLVIATQRPSVDVITGLIKANIPSRIAFAVAAGVDSRTILDAQGAEDLLGQGDMLYLPGGMGGLVRVQGVLVSRKEIERVVNNIKLTIGPDYDEEIIGESGSTGGSVGSGMIQLDDVKDEKYAEAVDVVRKTGRASATLLQRYVGIGYARAAKLLDIMEEKGLIGPSRGAKPREIYMELSQEEKV